MLTHKGGCHCGRVQFEVDAPSDQIISDCNCSICQMTGYLHLIVPKSAFRLLQGESDIVTYQFNTGIAKHMFCGHCGIKSFYVPRSHPDGVSVNARCVVPGTLSMDKIEPFNGADWESNIDSLRETI